MIGYIVGGIAILALAGAIDNNGKRKKRRLAEEAERKRKIKEDQEQRKQYLKPYLKQAGCFRSDYASFLASQSYLSGYDVHNFRSRFAEFQAVVVNLKYNDLPGFDQEIKLLDGFLTSMNKIEQAVKERNAKYIEEELKQCQELFDDVEGKPLDMQQRRAIVIDQDNNLVIAGAGSGKTTTIAGKAKYLINRLGIDPKDILLISFTKKSAKEMADRIRDKMQITLAVKTFHKLGLDIIAECENEKPSIFSPNQKTNLELLASFISNAKSEEGYFEKFVDFLSYYLRPYKDPESFTSDAEHNNYLREQKLEGYKMVEKVTADGKMIKYRERLKSQEEVLIANFLFRNNIEYKYEERYQYKTSSKKFGQYKPDFYLPGHDIYIEHFGVNEDGLVPTWFKGGTTKSAQERYTEGMEWKRNEHLANNTTMVETYSWEQRKGTLLSGLKAKLETLGVVFDPMSEEELWLYMQENTPEDIDAFTQLLSTFLSLFKSNNETFEAVMLRAQKEDRRRAALFMELFGPILRSYESYLKQEREIDFSDMINSASAFVRDGVYTSPYRYIIIDEFQDISESRFQLIKALLDQNPETRLMCVGDDWQSIFRFAGSDIGIFTGFGDYFKSSALPGFSRQTNISYIEYTYRFDNKLIELSENFILKNPNQLRKSLKSHQKSDQKPYTIMRYGDEQRDGALAYNSLCTALDDIGTRITKGTVLLLGRYEKDSKVFKDRTEFSNSFDTELQRYDYFFRGNRDIRINFMTAHSSKGLQADYVIILNCNSGTYGFPSEISDDPLLNFLLSKADQFPNGEERRLFYVAMTRARKHVYMLSSEVSPSKFITEIEAGEKVTALQCDWCDNGSLIERSGPFGYFYACNNSHYCNYTRKMEAADCFGEAQKLMQAKDYDAAIIYFDRTIIIDNRHSSAFYNMGRCYHEKKEPALALEQYDKAIALGYTAPELYFWRGLSNMGTGQYKVAVTDFSLVREKKGDADAINYYLAFACFKATHIIRAFEHIDRELELNPNSIDAKKLKDSFLPALKERFTTGETKIGAKDEKTRKGYIEIAISFDINIRFHYHKSMQFDGGEKSLRTIRPSGFKMVGESMCVSGYCHMRKEERTFALARIDNLVFNPEKIEFWTEGELN